MVECKPLIVGAETGKLGAALLDAGASHVLTLDHSQAMLDRSSEVRPGRYCPPRHPPHLRPSCRELSGII